VKKRGDLLGPSTLGVGAGVLRLRFFEKTRGNTPDGGTSVGIARVAVSENGDRDKEAPPLQASDLVDEVPSGCVPPTTLEERHPPRPRDPGYSPSL
jgi:hypothetical protein